MERKQLCEALTAHATELGWVDVTLTDDLSEVTLLLGAPGATEQIVSALLSKIRRELTDLGGPEDYPAIEEYDVAGVGPRNQRDQVPPAEAADLAAMDEDSEPAWDAAKLEAKIPGPVEDYSKGHGYLPARVSPKEAVTSGDLQDRGGVPHPQQIYPAEEADVNIIQQAVRAIVGGHAEVVVKRYDRRGDRVMMHEGYVLQARRSSKRTQYFGSIAVKTSQRMARAGWVFKVRETKAHKAERLAA